MTIFSALFITESKNIVTLNTRIPYQNSSFAPRLGEQMFLGELRASDTQLQSTFPSHGNTVVASLWTAFSRVACYTCHLLRPPMGRCRTLLHARMLAHNKRLIYVCTTLLNQNVIDTIKYIYISLTLSQPCTVFRRQRKKHTWNWETQKQKQNDLA